MPDAATRPRPLPTLAPQPRGSARNTRAMLREQSRDLVVVPLQLQPQQLQLDPQPPAHPGRSATTRPLLPLQPRLRLTPAQLTAAVAAVGAPPDRNVSMQPIVDDQFKRTETSSAAAGSSEDGNAEAISPSSSVGSDATSQRSSSSSSSSTPRSRMMKKCTVSSCQSYARSRGLCKAHGGGKRCKRPGCEVSDQGGGFCIRHGGGKRCLFEGCDKSAQSRHYCKAHGGGARCTAHGCEKSSQGGGLCRSHGGGPKRKKTVNTRGEPVESPRSRKRAKQQAAAAAKTLARVSQAQDSSSEPETDVDGVWAVRAAASALERIECEQGATALSFKIRAVDAKPAEQRRAERMPTGHETSGGGERTDELDTHMFVAASLLGMQAATAE